MMNLDCRVNLIFWFILYEGGHQKIRHCGLFFGGEARYVL